MGGTPPEEFLGDCQICGEGPIDYCFCGFGCQPPTCDNCGWAGLYGPPHPEEKEE